MSIQNTTLNPADVATGAGTFAPILSNGNLTVTGQQSSNFMAIRTVAGLTPGTWVWQATINALGNFTPGIGIAAVAQSLNAFGATGADWPGGFIWLNSGDIYLNGARVGTGSTGWAAWNTGDILSLAVNADLGLIWGKVNDGAWNNNLNANPAPPSQGGGFLGPEGGFSYLAAIGSSVMPVCWMNNFTGSVAPGQVTFNFNFPPGIPAANPARWLLWAGLVVGPGGVADWTFAGANGLFGDPGRGLGGLDFTQCAWDGVTAGSPGPDGQNPGQPNPFYLTAQGTGDGAISLNPSPRAAHAPPGFLPGWPFFDRWDPSTVQGSAVILPFNTASFPSSPGMVQNLLKQPLGFGAGTGGPNGLPWGKYYFEYTVGYDLFSQDTGVGVCRRNPVLTPWFDGGGLATNNINGGVMVNGGNITNQFTGNLETKLLVGPSLTLSAPSGSTIGVAVQLGGFIPAQYDPQQLQPVPLVCVPCRELLIGPNGFGGFGR